MKRLVWLALLAFGTALAQVTPVEPLRPQAAHGDCSCHCEGSCGMPDCIPMQAPAQPVFDLESPVPVVRAVAKVATPVAPVEREKFYMRFLPQVSAAPVLPVALALAPPASVPLFREHCSLLI
jgi:hypothetical protein